MCEFQKLPWSGMRPGVRRKGHRALADRQRKANGGMGDVPESCLCRVRSEQALSVGRKQNLIDVLRMASQDLQDFASFNVPDLHGHVFARRCQPSSVGRKQQRPNLLFNRRSRCHRSWFSSFFAHGGHEFSVAFCLHLCSGDETQSSGVHAVTLPTAVGGAVIEHVSKVRIGHF